MTKVNFILELNERLVGLPRFEVEEHLNFYIEVIEDRMEDGMTEEEAVAAAGSIDDIAEEIIAEIPLYKIAKEKIKPKRRLKGAEIVLLAAGSPVWVPLLIAAVTVVFSLYISLWAVVVSLWAVFGSFAGCFVGGIAASVILLVGKNLSGIAMIGAAIVCGGIAIISFIGCRAATKGCVLLTKKMAICIKKLFIKKEAV